MKKREKSIQEFSGSGSKKVDNLSQLLYYSNAVRKLGLWKPVNPEIAV